MRFDGKAVVVTGGALGIGQATCEILPARGASIAILDWDGDAGNETCERIRAAGGKSIFEKADVSDFDTVKSAIEKARSVFDRIDSLIVSAGIQRYGTAVS